MLIPRSTTVLIFDSGSMTKWDHWCTNTLHTAFCQKNHESFLPSNLRCSAASCAGRSSNNGDRTKHSVS